MNSCLFTYTGSPFNNLTSMRSPTGNRTIQSHPNSNLASERPGSFLTRPTVRMHLRGGEALQGHTATSAWIGDFRGAFAMDISVVSRTVMAMKCAFHDAGAVPANQAR